MQHTLGNPPLPSAAYGHSPTSLQPSQLRQILRQLLAEPLRRGTVKPWSKRFSMNAKKTMTSTAIWYVQSPATPFLGPCLT